MSGLEQPSDAFIDTIQDDGQVAADNSYAAVTAESPDDFDWFGGQSGQRNENDNVAQLEDPESEAIWGTIKQIVPAEIRYFFFIGIGLLLLIPSILGVMGSPMPKYFGVFLHVYTITGLTIVYLPGLMIGVVRSAAKALRRSLLWSKTDLPSYLDSISIPMTVAICGSILYGLWALELPVCKPGEDECYWKYVHRLYYVMLGACLAFSVEVALMKRWCNNYRRQTYQARIVDNRFKCYVVEQMKVAAKAKRQQANHGTNHTQGDGQTESQDTQQDGASVGVSGFLSRMAGYAPIPVEVTRLARVRDFSWFQRQVNSVLLMEHYQKIHEATTVTDHAARQMAKDIFEALCRPGQSTLTKEDFAAFVPADAVEDSYYVFDHDRDGEVTKEEFRNTIVDIFDEQANLSQAIADADMAISKINNLVVTVMWIAVSFAAMIACGIAVQNMLTLSLSTILGVNVIIGDVVRSVLSSIMFVIVNHPYDIGDTILVGPPEDAEALTVQQVNLLTTICKRWNGQELYFANHTLVDKPVTNLSRSPDQWERVDFRLPSTVNEEQLDEMRDSFADFFRLNSADFYTAFDMRAIVAADTGKPESDLDHIRFTLRVRCKATNDAEKQWNRHSRLLRMVKQETAKIF